MQVLSRHGGWLLGVALGCSAGPAPVPSAKRAPPPVAASVQPLPKPPAPIDPPAPPTLEEALCDNLVNCKVRETLASVVVTGGTHSLVRVTFPEQESPRELDGDTPCLLEQFWLVAQSADGRVTQHKPFAIGCSDEAPAGWCGLPPRADVRVEGTTVTATWYTTAMRCMGAYRSSGTEVVSLETLHSLRSESEWFRSLHFYESTTRTWDWQSQRGTFAWSVSGGDCPALTRKPTAMIPHVELDASFVNDGWKSLSFASCSTLIDHHNGVPLSGQRAPVELRLVASQAGFLFVELTTFHGQPAPPSAELKICAAAGVPVSASYCRAKEPASCARIGLDGVVRGGNLGSSLNPSVERAPERLRFKLALPPEHDALTVAYVDPKRGHSLSTTALKPPDSTALGELFHLDSRVARCQVQGQGLVLVRNPEAL